ncbi:hypothetical protein FDT66_09755 [Polaribacter aestuariivivens]|uniref:Lacal_2735 family protein n=1 Tax=Polaribacter aestuariivivens TaxID=2304626 RepID=A0A5S3N2E4_9FLAO|nr:hypothetical protein [Polaribacter aestuariivivens]TMM29400.1 hypothetical protein FDT66_09755 [Polaribacter aestuariivivens]
MSRISQLQTYKKHLEDRYFKLLEKSNDYKYIDESKSDSAAFKAMKIGNKLNKLVFLNKNVKTT